MTTFVLRRLFMAVPTILGVLLILFTLFFGITNPDNIARKAIGQKATSKQIDDFKKEHGFNKPFPARIGNYYKDMLSFNFGKSMVKKVKISHLVKNGIGPTLCVTLPIFVVGMVVALAVSMLVAMFRGTYVDKAGLFSCVVGMSVVYFLYIIGGQFLIGKVMKLFPVSGWSSTHPLTFLTMPVLIGTVAGISQNVRFYRTIMVNEVNNDYIRTAQAKGLGEGAIMFKHLLKNAMIPVLTGIAMRIPFLVMGSLLLESFCGIPGIGGLLFFAITNNDFTVISAIVYISALIYVVVNLLTDISYTLVDPRVRLK